MTVQEQQLKAKLGCSATRKPDLLELTSGVHVTMCERIEWTRTNEAPKQKNMFQTTPKFWVDKTWIDNLLAKHHGKSHEEGCKKVIDITVISIQSFVITLLQIQIQKG